MNCIYRVYEIVELPIMCEGNWCSNFKPFSEDLIMRQCSIIRDCYTEEEAIKFIQEIQVDGFKGDFEIVKVYKI